MDIQNNVPLPSNPLPKPQKATNVILMIIVVVLLLANGVTLYFLFKKPASLPVNTNIVIDVNENLNVENANTNTTSSSDLNLPPIDLGQKVIKVSWQDNPTPVAVDKFFDIATIQAKLKTAGYKYGSESETDFIKELDGTYKIWKVGTVAEGQPIINADVYLVGTIEMNYSFKRVIKQGDSLVVLGKQSNFYDGPISNYTASLDSALFNLDNNAMIGNLDLPDTISVPNTKYRLLKFEQSWQLFSDYSNAQKLFAYSTGQYLYKDSNSDCYIARAGDGTAWKYYLDLSSLDTNTNVNYANNSGSILLNIPSVLDNKDYQSRGGCSLCYEFADYITSLTQLTKIGTNSKGESFYTFKDVNQKSDPKETKSVLRSMYDAYYVPGLGDNSGKLSYDEFLKQYPIVIWRDPLDSFVIFRNGSLGPVAECGKPVIYLYPTKTTDVSVKVNPTGGFKFTDPDYGTGWLVKAEPNGNLYNYANKTNYPYLFWEGYGLNYQIPKQGFVVAKADVEKFLQEKLAQQGLIVKEYSEFIDFWLPKMQSDPYYFITFVPQAEFDKLAPLQINPKPDTVIRVFMDYKGLDKPMPVAPQILATPKRVGFTVVEWGGAIHK
ncbi:MAG: hypothetical protein WC465_00040 [Patescibacteria group bacterium]